MNNHCRKPNQALRAFSIWDLVFVLGSLVVLLLLLIPLARTTARAVGINCQNNLKQVALAFRVWSGENSDHYPMQEFHTPAGGPLFTNAADTFRYFQVMSNELSTPKILICPGNINQTCATNFDTDFNRHSVSFFIGLEARETNDNMFLTGDGSLDNGRPTENGRMALNAKQKLSWSDKNLHDHQGNIALTDGSVLRLRRSELRVATAKTGTTTNWLLFP